MPFANLLGLRMANSPSQSLPSLGGRRSRQGSNESDHQPNGTPLPQPPSKTTRQARRSAAEAVTAYWDKFSKIFLTQSALDELNRRAPRRSRRTILESRPWLRNGDIAELPANLKRAARQGGVDLGHLRGVKICPKLFRAF